MRRFWLALLLTLPLNVLIAQETITGDEAAALLKKDKSALILDVRTLAEFEAGHLPGALLLPFDKITAATASALLKDKTKPVIVYCRSGRRSAVAVETLKDLGYTKLFDLGGLGNWSGKLVTGPAKP